jgi:hypothetical protein
MSYKKEQANFIKDKITKLNTKHVRDEIEKGIRELAKVAPEEAKKCRQHLVFSGDTVMWSSKIVNDENGVPLSRENI